MPGEADVLETLEAERAHLKEARDALRRMREHAESLSADAAGAEGVAVELRLRMTLLRLCPAPALNVWV